METFPNPDLEVIEGNMSRLTHAGSRRRGFHHLHALARYGLSFRAARVLRLAAQPCPAISSRTDVEHLTSRPEFSAMVVLEREKMLFERYAADFGPERVHSIQSITKTILNLAVGRLVELNRIRLDSCVGAYLPEVGDGYRDTTVQQVLNMTVANDYSEDFCDPGSSYFRHEEAMGWRLPARAGQELTQRAFLVGIRAATERGNELIHYKDANTEVLGWIVERAGGRNLRHVLADIVDAAGLEGTFYISCDRDGVPTFSGGGVMTARDLARYMSLFPRRGIGVSGQLVGSAAFLDQTLVGGVALRADDARLRYSNHLRVFGSIVGHSGWGGQLALANLHTGRVAVFVSVLENERAVSRDYADAIFATLLAIVGPPA